MLEEDSKHGTKLTLNKCLLIDPWMRLNPYTDEQAGQDDFEGFSQLQEYMIQPLMETEGR